MSERRTPSHFIICAVTDEAHRQNVGGGVPIVFVSDQEAKEKTAQLIGRTVEGIIQDLENGVFLIVKI